MHKKSILSVLSVLAIHVAAYASMFASGGNEIVHEDNTVTHKFTEDGTFVLKESKAVRVLVVGGGGGGGAECGGGGGGGGVIEQAAYVFSPGEYTITVGAGGRGGISKTDVGNGAQRGANGGDTIIIDSNGTVVFRALGGGGGGSWSVHSGVAGGSGGGAAATGSGGISLDPSQGNAAGDAVGGANSLPTGGAGAGGPSSPISLSRGQGLSGTGGVGIISDISGIAEMYGAGGGGGNYNYKGASDQASGGDGIGGFGQGNTSKFFGNEKGRDGYGGGGGGGSNVTPYTAADGGSGVVMFRLQASDEISEEPAFVVSGNSVSVDSISFNVSIVHAGVGASDGTADIYAQVADSLEAWNQETGEFTGTEKLLVSDVAVGNATVMLGALRPSHEYVVRLVVRNDAGAESVSSFISFATKPLVDARWTVNGMAGEAGLYQYSFSDSGKNDLNKEFDPSAPGVTVQVGAIVAGIANNHINGIHGSSYTDANGNVWVVGPHLSYAYAGYIYLEGGITYNFFKHFYDGVRLEIDGENLIYSTNYDISQVVSYTTERTGWHKIRIWLTCPGGTNFGIPPGGFTLGLGYNTNGVTSLEGKPGEAWLPLENTADFELLRTAPSGRMLDISSWSIDSKNNTARFDLSYGEAIEASELYAVWGPIHGGNSIDGWAHVQKLADIDMNSGTASYTVDDVSDLVWFKFVAVDETGLHSWSGSQLIDSSSPVIGVAKVEHCGDQATISVRVDSVGTGDFSMKLFWGENEDLSSASVTNLSVTTPGVYDFTVPVTPAAKTYFKVEAETTDGGKDATVVDSFTTLAASSMIDVRCGVNNHWITFNGTISVPGAGATAITLWTGDSPETLEADPEVIIIPTSGPFTIRRLFPGEPKTIYWKFTYQNVGSGGTVWNSETQLREARTNENDINYTWKAEVLDGEWKDKNNWITTVDGAMGYPNYYLTYISFPNNSTNRIHLQGYTEGRINLNFSNSDITIYGDGADSSYLYTADTIAPASLNNSIFRLDNATLEEYDMFDYTLGTDSSPSSTLALTNGACLKLGGGKWAIVGKETSLFVGADSKFYFGDASIPVTNKVNQFTVEWNPIFGTDGESFTIEGLASMRKIFVVDPLGEKNQCFRLRGESAQLRVIDGVFGDIKSLNVDRHRLFNSDQPLTRDMDIVFEPANGNYTNTVAYVVDEVEYTEAVPFVSVADSDRAFAGMLLEESTGKIRFSVDKSSMRNSLRSTKQHLVLWKSGINTDNVELVQGEGYSLHYTYGWPSTALEPTVEGELPTGIWGNVPCEASTIIIIY